LPDPQAAGGAVQQGQPAMERAAGWNGRLESPNWHVASAGPEEPAMAQPATGGKRCAGL